jgi:glycosyltransferase involved in cell wall biosynthesis
MKIALFNYGSSGLFHYAASLTNALAQHARITHVDFFTSRRNNLTLLTPHAKLSIISHDAPHTLGAFLVWTLRYAEQKKIRSRLHYGHYDLMHITDTYPIYPLLHPYLTRQPLIFTQHDPTPHAGEKHTLATTLLQRYLRSLSKAIIVHGEVLKKQLQAIHPALKNPPVVIPLGDHSVVIPPHAITRAPTPHTLLFFGRIVAYKGLEVLLKSVHILQQRHIPYHLTIAGPGDLTPFQPQLKQLEHITIRNYFIPDRDLPHLFNTHAAIVLPYHEGTQSGVLSLALTSGIPIIATRVGAIPEIIQDHKNGLLIEPGAPHQLADAINELLNNPALQQQLSHAGKTTTRHHLSWMDIAQSHVDLYHHILAQKT